MGFGIRPQDTLTCELRKLGIKSVTSVFSFICGSLVKFVNNVLSLISLMFFIAFIGLLGVRFPVGVFLDEVSLKEWLHHTFSILFKQYLFTTKLGRCSSYK